MKLGLIGKRLSHSFSKQYFEQKFKKENLPGYSYELFELVTINELTELVKNHPELDGFNVTIPYKETILPLLDEIEPNAKEIGAVNTVKIIRSKDKTVLKGYNTDVDGFSNSIKPFLKNTHERALILGTGGASKAVESVLKKLGINTLFVSRNPTKGQLHYSDVNEFVMKYHKLIINCTPLGMYPSVDSYPDLPYSLIDNSHTLMDLVYNPELTLFLSKGKENKATTLNGLSMLYNQADKAWEIWSKKNA